MSEGTICPKLFYFSGTLTPEEFERLFVSKIQFHLERCFDLSVKMILSGRLLEKAMENFPWDRQGDNEWKGWILDWMSAVWPELERSSVDCNHSYSGEVSVGCPSFLDQEIWELWCGFLHSWQNGSCWNGRFIKGIGTDGCETLCGSSDVCGKFHLIPPNDWKLIKYPWLVRYDRRLPVEGEYPFSPPDSWISARLHGDSHGLLDANGNEWCWDKLHHNHWDVQLCGGGYLNVSVEGKVL
jgi:hypothetical protein